MCDVWWQSKAWDITQETCDLDFYMTSITNNFALAGLATADDFQPSYIQPLKIFNTAIKKITNVWAALLSAIICKDGIGAESMGDIIRKIAQQTPKCASMLYHPLISCGLSFGHLQMAALDSWCTIKQKLDSTSSTNLPFVIPSCA
ncbi:hypothetical protein BDR04DRAFT_1118329 [Suillus decipiens]|nr:hypothetical protein BDR04DRAFT_1118329 [Suillus decipiens]